MNEREINIIQETEAFVKKTLSSAEGGHDYWHIKRVLHNARKIAAGQDVHHLVVELGALLHDIADSKFHQGDETIGPKKAKSFLESIRVESDVVTHVENIIRHISFKGGNYVQAFRSPELDIVQDADRLDAIGAIGIARAFNYGGHKGMALFNPSIKPNLHMTKEEYKKSGTPTINHFYEKLLLLKDRMNTDAGKRMAEERHAYMEGFLQQFYQEWG